ncbi:hypothetical protein Selin_0495 [Desulfurispirillum indicum S5]|uniref:Uncharacterized protein n=1 Tax=Desulfurispirillum indicum (strain ATCC BAA-1389 / DSM 22839 / S5) TaxID=653733 RepID=E6W0J4_DESIS|nr:hypothetical protein [Desulfurispirillum indicum]ADU65246.1 hypothetical protein Selin_0495 [Desulfurispirillum indicum S5]
MERQVIAPATAHLRLLEYIVSLDETQALASARIDDDSHFVIQETVVQLAALHVRHRLRCERHVFLLALQQWQLHVARQAVPGPLAVRSTITAASSEGFACHGALVRQGAVLAEGHFLMGTMAYGGDFAESLLRPHYQEVIRCLSAGRYS